MLQITLATVAFALWHSLLCSKGAKERAKQWLGPRRGTGWYRAFFMAQAAFTSGSLFLYVLTRRHRTLYDAKGPGRLLGWAGQGAALLMAFSALRHLDTAKFLGIAGVKALEEGEEKLVPEAEAQGPEIEVDGQVKAEGIFRYTRHPLEWGPALLFLATPKMKTNWLAFALLNAIYALLGALHEEKRLLRQSKGTYAAYQKQVSFFFSWPKPDSR